MDQETPDTDYAALITSALKEFESYQNKCDNVESTYANLSKMTAPKDRQMRIFWANMEVLRPIIYSRVPRPLVLTRHKDRKKVPNKAGEVLQRVLEFKIEQQHLHDTLIQVRDDLCLTGRGVLWVADDGSIEHVDRKDFLHDPARSWMEVDWVARRAWYSRKEGTKRFGDKFKGFTSDAPDHIGAGSKIAVWEIWHKVEQEVVFLADCGGYQDVLEVSEPLFQVEGFFPCPKPAFATIEPRSLNPVPDIVFYKDQLDEINELTARISALSNSLRMKGFYASGVAEVGEAIEAAMRRTDHEAVLVPVANLASLGGQNLSQSIVWLPVREIAQTINDLIGLRRQLIQDVYEITGLSDIMRGATVASETATAQNLKAQYGSVRVRERQSEMVRIARDAIAMMAEILAEGTPVAELLEIAQIDDVPTFAEVQAQIQQQNERQNQEFQQVLLQYQQMQAQQPPEGQPVLGPDGQPVPAPALPPAPQPPVPIQSDLSDFPMHETIQALLQEQTLRPFTLSIETDSTIQPNEAEDKASRIEFVTAMSQFLQQAVPAAQQAPVMVPMLVELMKFSANGFRAGRELSDIIDQFGDRITEQAAQAGQQQAPQEPPVDPRIQLEQQKLMINAEKAKAEFGLKQQEAQTAAQRAQAELQIETHRLQIESDKAKAEFVLKTQEAQVGLERVRAETAKVLAETDRIRAELAEAVLVKQVEAETVRQEEMAEGQAAEQQAVIEQADQIIRERGIV